MTERELGFEGDRHRSKPKSFLWSIEVQENEREDSVQNGVVRVLAQSFSKRCFGVIEAAEIVERMRSVEPVGTEIAAHPCPRYSRIAS
jgi:hypothetical protein